MTRDELLTLLLAVATQGRDVSWLTDVTLENVVRLRDHICVLCPLDRFVVIRRLMGATQEELGESLHVHQSTISRRLWLLSPGFERVLETHWTSFKRRASKSCIK